MLAFKALIRKSHNKLIKTIIRNVSTQGDVPRRALLYVPGDSERKIKKTLGLNVDCIILDCEDGVAPNRKVEARNTIRDTLNNNKFKDSVDIAVRVNSVESGLCENDLQTILSAKNQPNTILLPKVNENNLPQFADMLKRNTKSLHPYNLLLLIESSMAILYLKEICTIASELGKTNQFSLAGLVFGSDDFCATLGVTRTENSSEIMYARQKIVITASAFHIQAIDMVHIEYQNLDSLKKNCEQGRGLGYTGKQVIHPSQIPIVQETFLPTERQIQWAKTLIEKFEEHKAIGKGAFEFQGKMIDMPTIRQAMNIVKTWDFYKASIKSS